MKYRRAWPAVFVLGVLALSQFGQAAWIQGKAWLAQQLLERAWQASHAGALRIRPWPWADTHPLARLSVPRLGVSLIVLAGDSGRTLAFGPGHAPASAPPGGPGVTLISGHRDTHFAFLADLRDGDLLLLETAAGRLAYRLSRRQVVDARHTGVDGLHHGPDRLLLVTCYPFDAVRPGGPLRYVVEFQRTEDRGRRTEDRRQRAEGRGQLPDRAAL